MFLYSTKGEKIQMERQRGERDKKTDKNEAVTRREGRRLEKKERQVELRGKRRAAETK